MRLEHNPKLIVRLLQRCIQCSADLCGMVSVVVHYSHAVKGTELLETTLRTAALKESRLNIGSGYLKVTCNRNSCKRIGYIVDTGRGKRYIKLVIAIGKGKKKYDKRETIKKRDLDRGRY